MSKASYIMEAIDLLMMRAKPVKKYPKWLPVLDYTATLVFLTGYFYGIYSLVTYIF